MEHPTSSTGNGRSQNNNMLEQTQQQVNEVVGIMRVNVEKVLERDQKLSELDSRADALQEGGKRFEQQAQKLKRKYWWKNLKMMIILGVIAVVILIVIILSFTGIGGGENSNEASAVTAAPAVSNVVATAQSAHPQ